MISLIRKIISYFLNPLPTITKRSRGVKYTKLVLPLSNLHYYSPHYQYSRFKEMYRSLYAVDPMLVERLFHEYEMAFCGGNSDNPYLGFRNFIIGYQLLHGCHIVGEPHRFSHGLQPTMGQIDELRINFPGYRFKYEKGYEGDNYWSVIYTGNDVPDQRILRTHSKLGSK